MLYMTNLRFALRTLFKTPFVTIFAIISIALGIGANTAMFSIFEQVLMRPLPVQEPDRLVNLAAPRPLIKDAVGISLSYEGGWAGNSNDSFSYPMFRDLEKIQTAFTGIAAHSEFRANLAAQNKVLAGNGLLVSGSYFSVLGIRPALGRLLSPQDDRVIGELPVVVLSYTFWKNHFGLNPDVLNQTMVVNGQAMTIIGVAPHGFEGTTMGYAPQVFVPITLRQSMKRGSPALEARLDRWAFLFARLKPGISIEQAEATLKGQYSAIIKEVEAPLLKGISEQAMAQFKAHALALSPGVRGQSVVFGMKDLKMTMSLLLGITVLVLIIACSNVANLLLARGAARAGEMAVRLSIGASRLRIVTQLLTESCLLALMAGIASIPAAQWTLDLVTSLIPPEDILPIHFAINKEALLFTAALMIGTGLLFGLFPALHISRPNLVSTIRGQAGQPSGAKSAARFRASLATAQIALSLTLLMVTGLFTKSLLNANRSNIGLNIDRVVTFSISPFRNGYTHQGSLQLLERLEENLAALPGVTNVTASMNPLLVSRAEHSVGVEGYQTDPYRDMAPYAKIGPAYFKMLGVPLISGREFTRSDAADRPKVAIINEAFAKKYNLGRDVLGKHIGDGSGWQHPDMEIVGLVPNAKYGGIGMESLPWFFSPYRQESQIEFISFYVQTSLNPEQLFPGIKKLMAQIDPNLPVENLRTMPQMVRDSDFIQKTFVLLSTAFTCLAVLLAAIGIYGVLAYAVAQRTREIGLRIALGASEAQVRGMVLYKVGIMTLIGVAIGLFLGISIGRTIAFMLYQLQGSDPVVLFSSAIILALVALIAGFIPAYRASKIDPMQALRYE
jgi:predicted permease